MRLLVQVQLDSVQLDQVSRSSSQPLPLLRSFIFSTLLQLWVCIQQQEFKHFFCLAKPGVQSKTGKELFHDIRPESSISSSNLTRFLYLITFATTYGSAIWMTFVSGVILSKSIPRQQFGFVQSRIFPLYLKFVAMGEVILLVLYSIMHPLRSTDSSGVWQLVNLLLLIIGTVFNVFILEPKTTKVRRRMPSFASQQPKFSLHTM